MSFIGFLLLWVMPLAAVWLLARAAEACLLWVCGDDGPSPHDPLLRPTAISTMLVPELAVPALLLSVVSLPLRVIAGLVLGLAVAAAIRRPYALARHLASRAPRRHAAPLPEPAAVPLTDAPAACLAALAHSRHPEFQALGQAVSRAWPDTSASDRRRLLAIYLDPASRMAALLEASSGPLTAQAAATLREALVRVGEVRGRGHSEDQLAADAAVDVIAKVMRDRMAETPR